MRGKSVLKKRKRQSHWVRKVGGGQCAAWYKEPSIQSLWPISECSRLARKIFSRELELVTYIKKKGRRILFHQVQKNVVLI